MPAGARAEAAVFHAVADPTRRAILDALRGGERSAGDLMTLVIRGVRRMTQPAFSQHLGVLREAGLVRARKEGRRRLYALRAEPLVHVRDWVDEYDAFWEDRLDRLESYLDKKGGS